MRRRDFLLASAAAGFMPVSASALAEPDMQFPTAPRDRLAVSSWPFRKLFHPKTGSRKLEEFPEFVVSSFGVQRIEPLNDHFASTEPGYLDGFNKALRTAGVRIVNIPVDPHHSFYDPDEGNRKAAVDCARDWIDVAVALSAPSIRVSIQQAHGAKPDLQRTVECLKQVAEYGSSKRVLVNLENDDPEAEDAFFVTAVIKDAGNDYLHALPDFCNSMLEKHGDEAFNDSALRAMFRYAYNISHVKDSELDEGTLYRVSLPKCFQIAKESGYRGYFSMEFEGRGDPVSGTKALIDASLRNL